MCAFSLVGNRCWKRGKLGVGQHVFGGVKLLSVHGCEEVSDILVTLQMLSLKMKGGGIAKHAVVGEIDGVLSAEEYLGCIDICCNAKVKTIDEVVGECTKYGSVLKMSKCVKMMVASLLS